MDSTIHRLLRGEEEGGHIFPFLWMHGEDEETLREYMGAIYNANIRAVCVESRPHPDYCGPGWWKDMDVVLEEAESRGMKVWILDDSHFPTGYANGALKNGDPSLCRQSLVRKELGTVKGGETIAIPLTDCQTVPDWQPNMMEQRTADSIRKFQDDRLLGVTAVSSEGETTELVMKDGAYSFAPHSGQWKIYSLLLTRNRGPHREYINMMDPISCKMLLDAVYEPHWEHYKEAFGKTIAGFFSDEPEIGNGHLYEMDKRIWEIEDQPWSGMLEGDLRKLWGNHFCENLALLWERGHSAAERRVEFMDAVTSRVEQDFSCQIGDWCRARGVEYIGHLIEDNNQHLRTGSSLGHFFRGLWGQDMAGIDDIGGQVLPQGERNDLSGMLPGQFRNGMFYHYVLGKLGASFAAIDPKKRGRCMCEIFGAYGWEEGVRLEKYLADHFLVRGVNHFVPHAFSMKEYPDPDCPPHFYAHGHNPQYRHFGELMSYMGRVCQLFSGGVRRAETAILYTAESDWAGECMALEMVAAPLYDRQIDYDFIPADVFARPEQYKTNTEKGLCINGSHYKALIIPQCEYLPAAAAHELGKLQENGCFILFVGGRPKSVCGKTAAVDFSAFPTVKPEQLPEQLDRWGIPEIRISPQCSRLRIMRYQGECERYMVVNEGTEVYCGSLEVPGRGKCYLYNAWENKQEPAKYREVPVGTELTVKVEPLKSLIVVFDTPQEELAENSPPWEDMEGRPWNEGWKRSLCKSVEYPDFKGEREISLPDELAEENPEFSGFVRYEKVYTARDGEMVRLEITDAYEGVEVFVNGESLGIQIAPPFRFELSGLLSPGSNQICIEVATTLERENAALPDPIRNYMGLGPKICTSPSGINGEVFLHTYIKTVPKRIFDK